MQRDTSWRKLEPIKPSLSPTITEPPKIVTIVKQEPSSIRNSYDDPELKQFVTVMRRVSISLEKEKNQQFTKRVRIMTPDGLENIRSRSVSGFYSNSARELGEEERTRRAKLGIVSPLSVSRKQLRERQYRLLEQENNRVNVSKSLSNFSKTKLESFEQNEELPRNVSDFGLETRKKRLLKKLELEQLNMPPDMDYDGPLVPYYVHPVSDGATQRDRPEENFERHSQNIKAILDVLNVATGKFKERVNHYQNNILNPIEERKKAMMSRYLKPTNPPTISPEDDTYRGDTARDYNPNAISMWSKEHGRKL
jgi:hypothetical protein